MCGYAEKWKAEGATYQAAAALLRVPERTLRQWRSRPAAKPLGRRPKRSSLERRSGVLETLREYGPTLGLQPLWGLHPDLPRREVRDLLLRARRVYRSRGVVVEELTWHEPRTVWAMDTTHAEHGAKKSVLSVGDLGSKKQIAWEPIDGKHGATIAAELQSLFDTHGRPLMIKRDNGSEFANEAVQPVIEAATIAQLPSPVATPRFNGSAEASIGSMKKHTDRVADRQGHEQWLAEDFEVARAERNQTVRPWGPCEPTPDEAWDRSAPVSDERRRAFVANLEAHRIAIRDEFDVPIDTLPKPEQARLERRAVIGALVCSGLLTITRRRIHPPISTIRTAIDP